MKVVFALYSFIVLAVFKNVLFCPKSILVWSENQKGKVREKKK